MVVVEFVNIAFIPVNCPVKLVVPVTARFPVKYPPPNTDSFADGDVVPMPTLAVDRS